MCSRRVTPFVTTHSLRNRQEIEAAAVAFVESVKIEMERYPLSIFCNIDQTGINKEVISNRYGAAAIGFDRGGSVRPARRSMRVERPGGGRRRAEWIRVPTQLPQWDDCEPRVLIAFATARLRKDKGYGATCVRHRGREKQSFDRFISSFVVKFPRKLWDDNSLMQLLGGLLRKDALTIFETLPQESVDEIHLAVEKQASKAYPNFPPEVTSLQKSEILLNKLTGWEGSYNLSKALELADASEAYDRVKDAALRLETTRKTAKESSQKPLYGKRSAWKAERSKSTAISNPQ
ncbi:unnamed protein product [Heligmosomoides polygyrus]|uniref:Retrotrans_gag domain-containing protein n=1 Tax=Heligmosomoides polygyrus TaxID=6339 RepID=A0A183G6Q1_HELPZ|nr:unnamed protein product [Heligmosomoides polygyrus]